MSHSTGRSGRDFLQDQGRPVLAVGRPHRTVAAGTPAWACRRRRPLEAKALRQLASSHNTRWCTGLHFCGRRNRVPRADVHDPLREVTGYPGGAARELLDHVADITNILATRMPAASTIPLFPQPSSSRRKRRTTAFRLKSRAAAASALKRSAMRSRSFLTAAIGRSLASLPRSRPARGQIAQNSPGRSLCAVCTVPSL